MYAVKLELNFYNLTPEQEKEYRNIIKGFFSVSGFSGFQEVEEYYRDVTMVFLGNSEDKSDEEEVQTDSIDAVLVVQKLAVKYDWFRNVCTGAALLRIEEDTDLMRIVYNNHLIQKK